MNYIQKTMYTYVPFGASVSVDFVSNSMPKAAERCRILKISIYIKEEEKNIQYLLRNAHKHTSSMD